ncbi:MAG: LamG-like jellyroll fold domain-containing protein [Myxococcota bacterium]|nr:LamG-like jellyroll fold domain-containing protein [Myxococcota bacterium]
MNDFEAGPNFLSKFASQRRFFPSRGSGSAYSFAATAAQVAAMLLFLSPVLAAPRMANAQQNDPEPFTFVVVADTQTDGGGSSINWDVLPQMIQDMNTHNPAFGLFVGDLVGGSYSLATTRAAWEDFLSATDAFTGVRLPIPGNHDVYPGSGTFDEVEDTFDWLPTDDAPAGEEGVSYYIDHENVRFIGITSDQEVGSSSRVSTQGLTWLDDKLVDAEQLGLDHTIVFNHHPVSFSSDNNLGGTSGAFWQTLVTNDASAVFSGHWHRYQPSQPGAGGDSWETIIGTGGGAEYSPTRPYQQVFGFGVGEVDGDLLVMSFYGDADGDGAYDDLLDSYVVSWPTTAGGVSQEPHGLIARYSFEGGVADEDAPEPLGRGLHATLEGGATVGSGGVSGEALWLSGSQDYAEAGAIDDYVLSINGDLTLSLWTRVDSLGWGTWANTLIAYATNDYYTEDEETNYSYWLNITDEFSGRYLHFYWEYSNGNNVSVYSSVPADFELDTWHHIAAVRDAEAMEVLFYLDGVQVGNAVSFANLPTGGGRGMLYLGSDTVDNVGYGYEISGALDEVCIYDEALGPDSVAALYGLDDCANHGSNALVQAVSTASDGGTYALSIIVLMLGVAWYALRPKAAPQDRIN